MSARTPLAAALAVIAALLAGPVAPVGAGPVPPPASSSDYTIDTDFAFDLGARAIVTLTDADDKRCVRSIDGTGEHRTDAQGRLDLWVQVKVMSELEKLCLVSLSHARLFVDITYVDEDDEPIVSGIRYFFLWDEYISGSLGRHWTMECGWTPECQIHQRGTETSWQAGITIPPPPAAPPPAPTAPLGIACAPDPAQLGIPFASTCRVTGGTSGTTPTLSLVGGALPPGLRLATGPGEVPAIEGTPTEVGSYQATLRASDGVQPDVTTAVAIDVAPAPTVTELEATTGPDGATRLSARTLGLGPTLDGTLRIELDGAVLATVEGAVTPAVGAPEAGVDQLVATAELPAGRTGRHVATATYTGGAASAASASVPVVLDLAPASPVVVPRFTG